MFAFYIISKNNFEKFGVQPEMTLGYYDRTKFEGEINWHPVVKQYMYLVKLDDIKINGKPLNMCKSRPEGCIITIDTGSSFDMIPTFADTILEQNNYPTYKVSKPCSSINEIGSLTFVISGIDYTYEPDEWLVQSDPHHHHKSLHQINSYES
jgi:hypothetical protein